MGFSWRQHCRAECGESEAATALRGPSLLKGAAGIRARLIPKRLGEALRLSRSISIEVAGIQLRHFLQVEHIAMPAKALREVPQVGL